MVNPPPKFKIGDHVTVHDRFGDPWFIGYIDKVKPMPPQDAGWGVSHAYMVISVRFGWYTNVYEEVCEPAGVLDVMAEQHEPTADKA